MAKENHRLFLKHFLPVENVLKAYLLSATGDMYVADDLLQEVSSVLWEKFDQYDEHRPFRSWALGIARMETLKWRQRLARSREVLSPAVIEGLVDTAEGFALELDDRAIHLRLCVEGLKQKTRRVLSLRYWEALTVRRIAEDLGRSAASIEMLLVRVRRQLRLCVERRLARASGRSL